MTPPNWTELTVTPVPEKLVPFIVTVVPAAAEEGVSETIVGVGTTANPATLTELLLVLTTPILKSVLTILFIRLFCSGMEL